MQIALQFSVENFNSSWITYIGRCLTKHFFFVQRETTASMWTPTDHRHKDFEIISNDFELFMPKMTLVLTLSLWYSSITPMHIPVKVLQRILTPCVGNINVKVYSNSSEMKRAVFDGRADITATTSTYDSTYYRRGLSTCVKKCRANFVNIPVKFCHL